MTYLFLGADRSFINPIKKPPHAPKNVKANVRNPRNPINTALLHKNEANLIIRL